MTHRFPIKEIARQAGLGTATVDRVINKRAHVSPQTKLRVKAAIEELTAQEAQLAARGRRLFFDVVVEAPQRFSREVKAAAEAVIPQIGSAVCRPRFLLQEIMTEDEVLAALRRTLKRGSDGLCLKARDTVKIRQAVNALTEANIPVVTLVTDITQSNRLAYVGLDNTAAGRTSAFLMAKTLDRTPGTVLALRSHEQFSGEEARELAFIARLADLRPDLHVTKVQGGRGVDFQTTQVLADALNKITDLRAVYSMGGGNRSILTSLSHHRLTPAIYIAHDLDRENSDLLAQNRIDFVLHHDLTTDIRNAFEAFLQYHRLTAHADRPMISTAQIVTPENMPV